MVDFFWNSGVDLSNPDHPLLQAWANTWNELLKTPNPSAIRDRPRLIEKPPMKRNFIKKE